MVRVTDESKSRSYNWISVQPMQFLLVSRQSDHPFWYVANSVWPWKRTSQILKKKIVPKLSFQQNFSKILSANKPEWGDIATEFCSDLYEWFALHREDNQLFVNQFHSHDIWAKSRKGSPIHCLRHILYLSQTYKVKHKRFRRENQNSLWRRRRRTRRQTNIDLWSRRTKWYLAYIDFWSRPSIISTIIQTYKYNFHNNSLSKQNVLFPGVVLQNDNMRFCSYTYVVWRYHNRLWDILWSLLNLATLCCSDVWHHAGIPKNPLSPKQSNYLCDSTLHSCRR